LSPVLAQHLQNVRKLVVVGARFREESYPDQPPFSVDAIHGEDDDIIPFEQSRGSFERVKALRGFEGEHFAVKGLKHSMNADSRATLAEILRRECRCHL